MKLSDYRRAEKYARDLIGRSVPPSDAAVLLSARFAELDGDESRCLIEDAIRDGEDEEELLVAVPEIREWQGVPLQGTAKRGKKGKTFRFASSPFNVQSILENDEALTGAFGLNLMTERPMVLKALPWDRPSDAVPRTVTDADRAGVITYISKKFSISCKRDFDEPFLAVCKKNAYSALEDMLASFEGAWDGVKRVETALSECLGVDDTRDGEGRSYAGEVLMLWMRGAIRRALHPGCQMDLCLIIAGPQGCGKTTFLRRLALSRDLFCENLGSLADPRGVVESISQSWIVCMDELAAMRGAKEITKVKAFLTATADDYRVPYARYQSRLARHCVFCGTSNELTGMLCDTSGNRRFVVLEANPEQRSRDIWSGDFEEYVRQLWAEAYATEVESPDAPLMLDEAMVETQAERNKQYEDDDELAGIVGRFLETEHALGRPVCLVQIFCEVFDASRLDYKKYPYRAKFQSDVTRIILADGTWERSASPRLIEDYGKQRCFVPVMTESELRRVCSVAGIDDDDESWDGE